MSVTATIDNTNKYGYGKFPFGPCQESGCERAACHAWEDRVVCRQHLPANVFFAPFLGQQTKLFAATERYVLGGGGAGGTKTYGGARLWLKQWQLAQSHWLENPHYQSKGWSLFLRRTTPELIQVINDFKSYYRQVDGGVTWNATYNFARFPNGYTVQFGGMEHESDWERYWGNAFTLCVFDEATQFTVFQIDKLDQRIRTDDPVLEGKEQLYCLTNPIGGETKQHLKRLYVKPAPPETPIPVQTKLQDGRTLTRHRIYIPSNVFDNPAYVESGEYEATLRRHSAATVRALLHNDWDVDEGCWVGEDWDPSIHVCEPFVIPPTWTKFKCGDYGFRARSSVLWIAVDPEDNWVVYRSLSATGLTAEDLSRRIREIEMQPLVVKVGTRRIVVTGPEWDESSDCSTVYGPMDAECWGSRGEGVLSRGETMQQHGTGFFRSKKDPDSAADQIRARLRRRLFLQDGTPVPGLRFMSTCKTRVQMHSGDWDETGPIVTIPTLPFDPNNPDRWDTTADDHDMDALGYGALSRPMAGAAEEQLPPGQGVVYDLLRIRDQQADTSPFPDWYRRKKHG